MPRADRTGRRVRCVGLDANHRRPRRRHLRRQRLEAVHHERPRGRCVPALRQDDARRRVEGHHGVRRRVRHAGFQRGTEAREDGVPREPDRRAALRQHGHPCRERRRRRRSGSHGRDERSRPRAGDDRRHQRRDVRTCARAVRRVRRYTRAVRPADRLVPDDPVPPRRHVRVGRDDEDVRLAGARRVRPTRARRGRTAARSTPSRRRP